MKLNKKKVLTASLAISLVAILSFGTIAWFSDTDEVTNTFKVATSTEEPDDIFSVDVFEQIDTDGDGVFDGKSDYDNVYSGYSFEDILPGDNLGKKPWVRNTGSYDQYIRVKVTINNASAWKTIFAEYQLTLDDIFLGHNEAEWRRNDAEIVEDTVNNTMTYVYYLNRILHPKQTGETDAYLFTSVKIPEQLTQKDMAAFAGGEFNLSIIAEAVQTEHVVPEAQKTADEAANAIIAFNTVMGD